MPYTLSHQADPVPPHSWTLQRQVRPKVLAAGPAGVSYNKWGVTRRRAHDGTRGVGHEPPNFTADLFTDASGYGVYDVCTMHGLEILPFK